MNMRHLRTFFAIAICAAFCGSGAASTLTLVIANHSVDVAAAADHPRELLRVVWLADAAAAVRRLLSCSASASSAGRRSPPSTRSRWLFCHTVSGLRHSRRTARSPVHTSGWPATDCISAALAGVSHSSCAPAE
jgi:hypothetical protein